MVTETRATHAVRPSWLDRLGGLLLHQSASVDRVDMPALVSSAIPRRHRDLVSVQSKDELRPVRCAPGPIQVAIAALIENAVHAIGDRPEQLVTVALRPAENGVRIEVTDNGRGFDTPSGVVVQAGAGLTIARTVIEKHGGQLWFETGASETKACLHLPLG